MFHMNPFQHHLKQAPAEPSEGENNNKYTTQKHLSSFLKQRKYDVESGSPALPLSF